MNGQLYVDIGTSAQLLDFFPSYFKHCYQLYFLIWSEFPGSTNRVLFLWLYFHSILGFCERACVFHWVLLTAVSATTIAVTTVKFWQLLKIYFTFYLILLPVFSI